MMITTIIRRFCFLCNVIYTSCFFRVRLTDSVLNYIWFLSENDLIF